MPSKKLAVIECFGTDKPPRLSGHRVVCTDTCLYSFGGYSPHQGHGLVIELWQFHFFRREWSQIPLRGNIPQEVASSAMILLNERSLLLVGGTGLPFGEKRNKDVFICNIRQLDDNGAVTWQKLPVHGAIPLARYGQAIAAHEDYLYCVGGTNAHTYSIEVHRLHLKTLQWERLADECADSTTGEPPQTRYRHEILIYDNKIIVFGGGTPSSVYGFENMPVFDIPSRKWTFWTTRPWTPSSRLPIYPAARRCHSVVKSPCGNYAIVAGGAGDRVDMFDDIWKFHLPTRSWQRLSVRLPQKIFFHSAGISPEGRMYIFGGVTDLEKNYRTNDISAFDVEVPSLQRLSLVAVLHFSPGLKDLDSHGLFRVGMLGVFHDKILKGIH